MGNYVFLNICLYTEGTTDIRFLENIVQQTYERAAIQAYGEIDIELHVITIDKTGLNFTQQVLKAAQKAKQEYGATIICVHSYNRKIQIAKFQNPFRAAAKEEPEKPNRKFPTQNRYKLAAICGLFAACLRSIFI